MEHGRGPDGLRTWGSSLMGGMTGSPLRISGATGRGALFNNSKAYKDGLNKFNTPQKEIYEHFHTKAPWPSVLTEAEPHRGRLPQIRLGRVFIREGNPGAGAELRRPEFGVHEARYNLLAMRATERNAGLHSYRLCNT